MQDQPTSSRSRSEYLRAWRLANAERTAAYRRRYRERHPDRVKAAARRHYETNCEQVKARSRSRHAEHRDEVLKRQRDYREANAAALRESERAWRERNVQRVRATRRANEAARRARQRGAFVEAVDLARVWQRDRGVCGICGEAADPLDWHLDHVVPLSRGGEHSYANTQVAHPRCNLVKGAAA